MYIYLIALIPSFILTYLVRKAAIKKSIVDKPNERSSHTTPTPRGGGLAIVIVWFGGLIYLFFQKQIEESLFYALLSGVVLAVISLLDDLFDLKPSIRIIAQSITAFLSLYFLRGLNLFPNIDDTYFFLFINLLVFIGIIWFINLYNFLDGIDAYASQEAILVALGLFIITGNSVLLLLIASVLGFLLWNWPKAKIFMGDVGSTQLGFILIVFGIHFNNTGKLNIIIWLILTSLFWFDATLTLYRRWRKKEKLSEAHKKHAYQRIVQAGWSHQKTVLASLVINLILFLFVLIAIWYKKLLVPIFLMVILFLYLIVKFIDKKKAFE